MKQEFVKYIQELNNSNLTDDISGLQSVGIVSKDPVLNQKTFKAEVSFEEICHIIPDKPLFKPGCLLTSPDGLDLNEDSKLTACGVAEDLDAFIDIGLIKEINELGEIRRVLSPEIIMVASETIEIKRKYKTRVLESTYKTGKEQTCVYFVRHLLQVIDDKRKMFVPTKLFRQNVSQHYSGHDLSMENHLDIELIMHLYKCAVPERVVEPLKILENKSTKSKNTCHTS